MAKPRTTISKGRFVSACECPTKLYYKCHPESYPDGGDDSDFLRALAEGGFQVGELAKLAYPGAVDHSNLKQDESWAELQRQIAGARPGQRLVFFEPTIISRSLLVRADILEYEDGTFWLHEVKSRSHRRTGDGGEGDSEEDPALGVMTLKPDKKTGLRRIRTGWLPYVLDVTFQAHVIERAFAREGVTPRVHADLIVADKSAVASRDGINQLFKLVFDPKTGRTSATTRPGTTAASVGDPLLMSLDINEGREHALQHHEFAGGRRFHEFVSWLESLIQGEQKADPVLKSACRDCEFRPREPGVRSGFNECWTAKSGLSEAELESERLILEVWNWRADDRDPHIANGIFLIRDLDPQAVISRTELRDMAKGRGHKPGEPLNYSARRYQQYQRVVSGTQEPYLEKAGIRSELAALKWPLSLIDFETARVAIPFHRGQPPYGQIAFQFSHHLMHEDGRIEHESQFLEATPGVFPNFRFVRALKKTLGDRGGSVMMFHHHEKTVLNDIYRQLDASSEPDRDELMQWIRSLARPTGQKEDEGARPERELVDLRKWVLDWWYHPATRGSNSIKAILPVVFAEGGSFESLYSKPIYGATGGIRSLNFKDRQWIDRDPKTGVVKDPYKTLEPVFAPGDPLAPAPEDRLFQFGEINQGGAAMQAYARMQFTEMTPEERQAMQAALLRYCELDTFAMGILIQYLRERSQPS